MQSSETVTLPFGGMLQVEQTGKFSVKVYCPPAQTLQLRLCILVPSEEIYFPAGQFVHAEQLWLLVEDENVPDSQLLHWYRFHALENVPIGQASQVWLNVPTL